MQRKGQATAEQGSHIGKAQKKALTGDLSVRISQDLCNQSCEKLSMCRLNTQCVIFFFLMASVLANTVVTEARLATSRLLILLGDQPFQLVLKNREQVSQG